MLELQGSAKVGAHGESIKPRLMSLIILTWIWKDDREFMFIKHWVCDRKSTTGNGRGTGRDSRSRLLADYEKFGGGGFGELGRTTEACLSVDQPLTN